MELKKNIPTICIERGLEPSWKRNASILSRRCCSRGAKLVSFDFLLLQLWFPSLHSLQHLRLFWFHISFLFTRMKTIHMVFETFANKMWKQKSHGEDLLWPGPITHSTCGARKKVNVDIIRNSTCSKCRHKRALAFPSVYLQQSCRRRKKMFEMSLSIFILKREMTQWSMKKAQSWVRASIFKNFTFGFNFDFFSLAETAMKLNLWQLLLNSFGHKTGAIKVTRHEKSAAKY